jgi:hypothetical protein
VRIGGRWFTSREAVQRFLNAQNPTDTSTAAATEIRSPAKRRRESEAAAQELAALGIV